MAWFLGEDSGRAIVGTADAMGRVKMTSHTLSPGLIAFPVACGAAFPAGAVAFVDPGSAYLDGEYLLVRPRLDDGDPWLAFARSEGSAPLLDRMNGEVHVYSPDRYTVVGVIVGVLVRPPRPLSA